MMNKTVVGIFLIVYMRIYLVITDIAARLAQSVERETFNLKAKGSSPLSGEFFIVVAFII